MDFSNEALQAAEKGLARLMEGWKALDLKAKAEKNWALSDAIRDRLTELGFEVKDTKDGFSWTLNK